MQSAPTLVPVTGLEPVIPCGRRILSPLHIPILPHRHNPAKATVVSVAHFGRNCNPNYQMPLSNHHFFGGVPFWKSFVFLYCPVLLQMP